MKYNQKKERWNKNLSSALWAMKTKVFPVAMAFTLVSFQGDAQIVNIRENQIRMEKLIKEIQKQTGYNFLYDDQLLEHQGVKSISIDGLSVAKALDMALAGTDITYVIKDKSIVLKKKKVEISSSAANNTVQEAVVTGVLRNDQGNTIAGSTIRNTRTGAVVTTNTEGKFSIAAKSDDVLEFSFLGYQKGQYKVKEVNKPITMTLSVAVNELTDVVVVGYGSQQKKVVTGAINTIKGEELSKSPAVNISNTLMGRAPGLSSTMISGAPDRDRAAIKI